MAYKVIYGESNLSDYCLVLNVKRSILPNRSNFSKQIPTMNGSYFTGSKYAERTISLEVAILTKKKEEYAQKVSELAKILDVIYPSKLIIDDEPYKCYYAVLDGSTDLEKFAQTGRATLNFICHDPLAYSLYWNTHFANDRGICDLESYGTTDTYPVIDVDFANNACFFQVTNPTGQTVLIGAPKDITKPNKPLSDIMLNDNCQSADTITALSETLIDSDKKITGQCGVGFNGDGFVCTNFGTAQDNKWTGGAFKMNVGQNVNEFEVTVDMTFSSQGKNYVAPTPTPPVPQPPTPTPPNKPNNGSSNTPSSSLGTYKVVNCGGLWINREANTKNRLYAMAPGTHIYPTEIKNGWAKHTHSNKWNTFTGWSSMKYLQKVSNAKKKMTRDATGTEYADDQTGVIEIYGFDQNGAKLFKMVMEDVNQFYEYVDPKIYIGNTLVLHDGKNTPSPRKTSIKDDKGQSTQSEVASGVFGDYNDFNGQLVVRREKNSQGQDLWSCEVRKISNGKVVASMSTNNSLSNSAYPKGALNYIGVYIGKYGQTPEVSVMAVTNVKVKKLNMKTDQEIDGNAELFKEGDHLQIDFNDGNVTLNDQSILSHVDIGSEFFTIPAGRSQIICRTDSESAGIICGFKDRFI